ncbi:hypothetical protein [Psychroflexus sediminis]|uniref:Uncharacterized protein n=1 Tax=Psychroflexus sediminis TaxID=470826 RepID=A0A1G7TWF9_9FLAO|nr:hypothetical protein [Psychroflexus sediminis]SDG39572.1 hypothetical protein SAMN04488027_10199 [Psychroflexus sediminis]
MKNFIKYTLLIVLMLAALNAEAQTGSDDFDTIIGFEDSVNDTAAPINFLIPLAIAIGVVLGIKKLK